MSAFFAGAGFLAGIVASWYWFKSTKVSIDPSKTKSQSGQEAFVLMRWIDSVMTTSATASQLNAKAAGWTAVSVFCSGLSGLLHSN